MVQSKKKKEAEKKDKNKTILAVIWIITLIITVIGASFAYFTSINRSRPQVIITKSLNLSLVLPENNPKVDKIHPTEWSNTMSENENNNNIAKIPFSIRSTSRVNGNYTINLSTYITENEKYDTGSADDIKYRVYKNDSEVSTGNFHAGDVNIEIVKGTISDNQDLNDEYVLYIYIENKNEPQNRLQDISFDVRLQSTATVY